MVLIYIDRTDKKREQNVAQIWNKAKRKIILCACYYI